MKKSNKHHATIFKHVLKVYFEYWIIFEGYMQAELFEKQLQSFGKSLIFSVFDHIFKNKDQ